MPQRADDLDEAKIFKAKEEAEKLLKDKGDQKDFAEASSQLANPYHNYEQLNL